jgi:serine/threonine-protein kinase
VSFFSELRRRNVFKVGAAYAIVAWLLIQVADVVLPTFNSPAWVMQVFTFFMILGFPITLLMAWAYEMTSEGIKAAADIQPTASLIPATGQRLNYVILGLVVLAVGFLALDRFALAPRATMIEDTRGIAMPPASAAGLDFRQPGTTLSPRAVRRGYYHLGRTRAIDNTRLNAHVALSRDGRRLAHAANSDGTLKLYVRELNQLEARAVPGTEGAQYPFFSPDGEWIAYFDDDSDHKLKRVAVRGGQPQILADILFAPGGFWGDDDSIVFSSNTGGVRSLWRIPATGGTPPESLFAAEPELYGYTQPAALPGGNAILFVRRPGAGGSGLARDGCIAVLSLESGEYRVLIEGAHTPRYVPTGHVVFARAGALWAVPFDAERLEITGPEVPVIDAAQQNDQIGGAAFAFSDDGLLVYLPGGDSSGALSAELKALVWVDRQGREEPLPLEARVYRNPRLSPDGRSLAVSVGFLDATDIYISDLAGGTPSRLTFDSGEESIPLWTPDNQRVVFWASSPSGAGGLFSRAANGTGQAERLTTSSAKQTPDAFAREGTELVFGAPYSPTSDLHVLSLDGEIDSRTLLPETATTFEGNASISPNGRWIAYGSDETGDTEIYVRPYPNVDDGRWQISIAGGFEPRWKADGTELFFRDGDAVMAVSVETEGVFSRGTPDVLFPDNYWSDGASAPNYDVAADGRFLMMKSAGESEQGPEQALEQTLLVTIENWFEELRRLAPPTE